MILAKVISGGQSGADQAALRAARHLGIKTGGTAPRLFMAEDRITSLDGQPPSYRVRACPWLKAEFGLVECPEPSWGPPFGGDQTPEYRKWLASIWPPRTRLNVRDSDATCWLGPTGSPGHKATARAAKDYAKPFIEVPFGPGAGPMLLDWLERERVEVLNCAGSRESSQPGIGDRAELFLRAVFRRAIGGRAGEGKPTP